MGFESKNNSNEATTITIDLALLTAKDNIKYRKEIIKHFNEAREEGLEINIEVSLNLIHVAKLNKDHTKWPEIIKFSMEKHLGELSELLEKEEIEKYIEKNEINKTNLEFNNFTNDKNNKNILVEIVNDGIQNNQNILNILNPKEGKMFKVTENNILSKISNQKLEKIFNLQHTQNKILKKLYIPNDEITEFNQNLEKIKNNLQLSINLPRNQLYIGNTEEKRNYAISIINEIIETAYSNGFKKLNLTSIDGNKSAEVAKKIKGNRQEIVDFEEEEHFWVKIFSEIIYEKKEKYNTDKKLKLGINIGLYFDNLEGGIKKRIQNTLKGPDLKYSDKQLEILEEKIKIGNGNIKNIATQMPVHGTGGQFAEFIGTIASKIDLSNIKIVPGLALKTKTGMLLAVIRTQIAQISDTKEIFKSNTLFNAIKTYGRNGFNNLGTLVEVGLEPTNTDLLLKFGGTLEKGNKNDFLLTTLGKLAKNKDFNPEIFIKDYFSKLVEMVNDGSLEFEIFKQITTFHLNPNGQSPESVAKYAILIAKEYKNVMEEISNNK